MDESSRDDWIRIAILTVVVVAAALLIRAITVDKSFNELQEHLP